MASQTANESRLSSAVVRERLAVIYGRPVWRPHGDGMAELLLTVLSQNTSDTNSGRAFMRLHERFSWEGLLAADPVLIEDLIRVGGLAKIKAPRIKEIAREVWERYGSFDLSFLKNLPLEDARAWLERLPGVGPKTAACVLMFAFGRPALPVDTHVHRVALRLGFIPSGADAIHAQKLLETALEPDEVYPFHILLIRHGRRLCRAQRPLCSRCPLLDGCPYGQGVFGSATPAAP